MSPLGQAPDDWNGQRSSRPDEGWAARAAARRVLADARLADRAAEALSGDPRVRGRHLEILVQNSVVILIGEVGSAEASEAARCRAWEVPGVADVCNRLTVPGAEG